MLDITVKLVGMLLGWVAGSAQRSADRRIAYISPRISPVEQFHTASFQYLERLDSILRIWGPCAPYTPQLRARAMPTMRGMIDTLSISGSRARQAAQQIDADLHQRVRRAEAAGVTLCANIDNAEFGREIAPLLRTAPRSTADD